MTFTIPELQELLAAEFDWRNRDGSLDYHACNRACAEFIEYASYEDYNTAPIEDVRDHIRGKIAKLSEPTDLTKDSVAGDSKKEQG